MTTPDELEALAAAIRMYWPYPGAENLKRALDCVEREAARLRAEQAPPAGGHFGGAILGPPSHCQECRTEFCEQSGCEQTRDGQWICDYCFAAGGHVDKVQAPKPEGSGAAELRRLRDVEMAIVQTLAHELEGGDDKGAVELARMAVAALAKARHDALVEGAVICDGYGREGDRLSKEYACETADELAARLRARAAEAGKR